MTKRCHAESVNRENVAPIAARRFVAGPLYSRAIDETNGAKRHRARKNREIHDQRC